MARLLLFFLAIAALASCSIEKRLYRPGFHVDWRKSAEAKAQPREEISSPQKISATVSDTLAQEKIAAAELIEEEQEISETHSVPVKNFVRASEEKVRTQAKALVKKAGQRLSPRHSRIPEPIKDAFWAGLLIVFIAGPISAGIILAPEFFISSSSSGDDTFWLFTTPAISVSFIFFAPRLIRECAQSMRNARSRNPGAYAMGAIGIFFCVLGSLLSVATFVGLLLNPIVLLLVALACLLALLYAMVS